jgi:Helix-turn-helix
MPRDPGLATLSAAIEALMDRHPNTTQKAVAERAGLEIKQVNSYVRGQIEPSFRNFRRLARGLGVKSSELMAAIEALEAADGRAPEDVACGARATPAVASVSLS